MPGKIIFKYNAADDVVVAIPNWHVKTVEDCRVWHDEWTKFLGKYHRKMDVIIILDNFHIDSSVASYWGEFRAEINNKYIRHGYRVNPEMLVSLYVKTSGMRYNADTAEAASVEDAIVAIKAARQKDQSR